MITNKSIIEAIEGIHKYKVDFVDPAYLSLKEDVFMVVGQPSLRDDENYCTYTFTNKEIHDWLRRCGAKVGSETNRRTCVIVCSYDFRASGRNEKYIEFKTFYHWLSSIKPITEGMDSIHIGEKKYDNSLNGYIKRSFLGKNKYSFYTSKILIYAIVLVSFVLIAMYSFALFVVVILLFPKILKNVF